MIEAAGIIAAGEGSRLRRDGFTSHKPLVTVGGVALVERVAANLVAAGARSLAIIFNEEEADCAEHVRRSFPTLPMTILLKTTSSSLESFGEVLRMLPAGRALVSTVDAFAARDAFVAFVREARNAPAGASVLAVTGLVDDEKPLWVRLGADGRILAIGGDSGDCVTAGVYLLSEAARARVAPPDLARLRDYLGWLLAAGEPLYGATIGEVVDVDRAEDVALAEELLHRMGEKRER